MKKETDQLRTAVALLRITMGIIILITWIENVSKGLYGASGLTGFLVWLSDPNGNAGSFTLYHTFINNMIIPIAGPFGALQLVVELLIGLALLSGAYTRIFGIGALFLFFNLFLAYLGGQEWIWTYVLLFMATLTVVIGAGGRKWGVDGWLLQKKGNPQYLFTR